MATLRIQCWARRAAQHEAKMVTTRQNRCEHGEKTHSLQAHSPRQDTPRRRRPSKRGHGDQDCLTASSSRGDERVQSVLLRMILTSAKGRHGPQQGRRTSLRSWPRDPPAARHRSSGRVDVGSLHGRGACGAVRRDRPERAGHSHGLSGGRRDGGLLASSSGSGRAKGRRSSHAARRRHAPSPPHRVRRLRANRATPCSLAADRQLRRRSTASSSRGTRVTLYGLCPACARQGGG